MPAAIIAATLGSCLKLGLPMLINAVTKDRRQGVESIQFELKYIHAFCREHSKSGDATSDTLKLFLEDMEQFAYEIEDFTDCFLRKIIPGDRKAAPGSFPHRAWCSTMRMFTPRSIQIDRKISQLKEKSKILGKILRSYVKRNEDAGISNTTATKTVVASHLSMEDAAEKLLQLVIREPTESENKLKEKKLKEKKLRVISIVGYGTLGNLVDKFLDQVCNHFNKHDRVNAAGKSHDQLWGEVLKHLAERNDGPTTSLAVTTKSRYLIVIDNVERSNLEDIIMHCDNHLNREQCGNEVEDIFIVATTDCSREIHCKCRPLPPDGSTTATATATAQYLEIGELKITTDTEETGRLEKKLQDVLVSNYAKSLSSHHFEECLLYLCMFPHYYLVRWNLLIMRFLAEGIVFTQPERDQIQRVGEFCSPQNFLKILIDHNVVQPIQLSKNGEVKRCQPHLMMLNHISGLSKSKNFIALFCGSKTMGGLDPADGSNPIRRLSIHPIEGETTTLSLPKGKDLCLLRTLVVFHTAASLALISELPNYELLRVLDLKKCSDVKNEHVKKICDLLLLKYLGLGPSIDKIPKEIDKLEWLQTLDMTKTKKFVGVPMEVMELPELINLLGKFQLYKDDIRKNKKEKKLSTKGKLERLSGFFIDNSKEFRQFMSRMNNLKKVKIWVDKENWTDDVSAAINTFTMDYPSEKRSLSIECDEYPSEIIACLEHPGTSVSSLKLCGDLKKNLGVQEGRPTIGLKILGLRGITVLCLSGTNLGGAEILSVLKLFEALTSLKLVEKNIGPLVIEDGCLFSLKRLCLVATDTLSGIGITAKALVCLVSLHMLYTNLRYLPSIDITRLNSLEEIGLHSGAPLIIKQYWQNNASKHEKKPKVVFIQSPVHSVA